MNYLVKRLFLVIVVWGGFFAISKSQTPQDLETIQSIQWEQKTIAPGIELFKCEAINLYNSLQSIVYIEIDTAKAQLKYQLDYSTDYMPTSIFAERNQAVVAINGTYFTSGGNSQHFMKIENNVYFRTLPAELETRASAVFTVTDGNIGISNWNKEKEVEMAEGSDYALVCGPLLILDGEYPDLWDGQYITYDRHPRSCIGITQSGKFIIMAVDGRQTGRAEGMDLFELRFLCKALGCVNAMNLDGGGSTALFVKGEPKNGIVNVPIDQSIRGKERNVGNILYVAPKDAPKPFIYRNNAPGGISGMSLWIKADGYLSKNAENKLISPYLFDYTGNNVFTSDHRISTATLQWSENQVNFHPTVSFDSAAVLQSQRKATYSTFFSVNTLNKEGTLLGFDEFGSTFTKIRSYLFADKNYIYVHDGSSQSSGLNYNLIPYKPIYDQSCNIFNASYGKSADEFSVNGINEKEKNSNFNTRSNINAIIQIGARNSYPTYPTYNQYFLRGEVAEIIAYPDTLTEARSGRILSYLAIKYGITIGDEKFRYISSYGDSWWSGNVSSYTPYSNFITGIVRDDKSDINQPISKGIGNQLSNHAEGLLTLVNGVNSNDPLAIEENQYYLVIGSSSHELHLIEELEANNLTYQCMKRHWKVSTRSESTAFSILIDIPEALISQVNSDNCGLILKSGTISTFMSGNFDKKKKQITVNNLTAKKGDLLYLALNKGGSANITNVNKNQLPEIFYNRTLKTVYIITSESTTSLQTSIYSITGESIMQKQLNNQAEIPLSTLKPGVYIICITDNLNKQIKTQKIIIN